MKTKIERYTEKFIDSNFDKKDKRKDIYLKFEWFVNSLHCWEYSSQSYNAKNKIGQEISLDTAQGGDAFFLLVGNKIYSLKDSLDDIKKAIRDNKNKIEFHLIQTKKSNNAKLGDFKNFVEIPIKVIKNEGIADGQKELKELASFVSEIKDNPELEASFILTFYTEKDENDIIELRKSWTEDIKYIENQYASYGTVKIFLEGSKKLNQLYEQFNSNDYKLIISRDSCKFENNYIIGFLSAKELLDTIAPIQENGVRALYPDVFRNNIRLYLGPTEVNQKIEQTLREEPHNFHLYNNGLTITTKEIKPVLENYIITPINIVNGCQTANSVYNVFKANSTTIDTVKIPVKIIKASDDEYEKITIRTNSQNGISEKDLISISNIQKDLEDSLSKNKFQSKTFSYKRQNSVDDESSTDVDYVVNINDILRAFFSTVLYIPHKVSGYFDKTTSNLIDIVFEDRFIDLYQITVSIYKVASDYVEDIYPDFKKQRYHLLYLLYRIVNKNTDIDSLEKYFVKEKSRKSFEELDGEDLDEQIKLTNSIYSNLHLLNNEEVLKAAIDYIISVIKDKYPQVTNLDTREKEKILYKTVDKNQRGERIFSDFDTNFIKSIDNIKEEINGTQQ